MCIIQYIETKHAKGNKMTNANYETYLEIWKRHYSKTEFAGTSIEAAAAYSAMDCMNRVKGFDQVSIDDDIAYWEEKTGFDTHL